MWKKRTLGDFPSIHEILAEKKHLLLLNDWFFINGVSGNQNQNTDHFLTHRSGRLETLITRQKVMTTKIYGNTSCLFTTNVLIFHKNEMFSIFHLNFSFNWLVPWCCNWKEKISTMRNIEDLEALFSDSVLASQITEETSADNERRIGSFHESILHNSFLFWTKLEVFQNFSCRNCYCFLEYSELGRSLCLSLARRVKLIYMYYEDSNLKLLITKFSLKALWSTFFPTWSQSRKKKSAQNELQNKKQLSIFGEEINVIF